VKYARLIIVIIVSLIALVGCSPQKQLTETDKPTREEKVATSTTKEEDKPTIVWTSNQYNAAPRMAYKGYFYEAALLARGLDDPNGPDDRLKGLSHVGSCKGEHFFIEDAESGETAPLRLWAGGGSKDKPTYLRLFERGSRAEIKDVPLLRSVKEGPDFELIVEMPKLDTYTVGTTYSVLTTLKNTSAKDVEIRIDDLFDIRALDEKGYTIWEPQKNKVDWPRWNMKSGEAYSIERRFYVPRPGTYKIICSTKDDPVEAADKDEVFLDKVPQLEIDPIIVTVVAVDSGDG